MGLLGGQLQKLNKNQLLLQGLKVQIVSIFVRK